MAPTLIVGSTGEDVRKLQAALNYHRRGPFDEHLATDGIFGPSTQHRAIGFQETNRLTPDGIVGPNTAAALMTVCRSVARYDVTRNDVFVVESIDRGQRQTTVTREYELKDGIQVALSPWESPPAKLRYVLEFEMSWVIKNPRLPAPLTLSVGAEIGRMLTTPAPDAPYTYAGAGTVAAKFERDFTLGPVTFDSALQAAFEAEHQVGSIEVEPSLQLSLVSGISFAVVHERFYLFTQGELGAALKWSDATIKGTGQWEGSAGFKLTF